MGLYFNKLGLKTSENLQCKPMQPMLYTVRHN